LKMKKSTLIIVVLLWAAIDNSIANEAGRAGSASSNYPYFAGEGGGDDTLSNGDLQSLPTTPLIDDFGDVDRGSDYVLVPKNLINRTLKPKE